MKVLHVTLSLHPGGRREAIVTLARGLAAEGVESHLCCTAEMGEAENSESMKGSLCLHRQSLLDRSAMHRLRSYCREQTIDVLHSHDAASQFACATAMPFAGPPLLMTFHRSRDFESALMKDQLRNALVGLRTRTIVTASRARQQHYQERNPLLRNKVECIPLGIDVRRFAPNAEYRAETRQRLNIGENGLLVGVAGHFGKEKGVDIAIDAFQRMLHRCPQLDATLVVLGTGTDECVQLVRNGIEPALSKRIHLLGFQRYPARWFTGCDLFLHAARCEAFGLVLIEAMACGLPVLASADGGMLDIVIDGTTGRLTPPGDTEAMSKALEGMLAAPRGLADMGRAARQRAMVEYTETLYVRRHIALYRHILGMDKALPRQEGGC